MWQKKIFLTIVLMYTGIFLLMLIYILLPNNCTPHSEQRVRSELPHVHLFVCVLSAPKNTGTRNTVRTTWAEQVPVGVRVMFVIGLGHLDNHTKASLYEENEFHGDLVLLDTHTDSYVRLTSKVVEAMKWVQENINFDYFMKSDDDAYVRLDKLIENLSDKPRIKLYQGYFLDRDGEVYKTGKWAEPVPYICEKYVSYALGAGYILSRDLVEFIAENSEKWIFFKNEDVSIGTWLAVVNLNKTHEKDMTVLYTQHFKINECFGKWLILHPIPLQHMKLIHNRIITNNSNC